MPPQQEAVKWRMMDDLAAELVLEDVLELCGRLKEKFPETVFFDGRHLGGDEFRLLPPSTLPAQIFESAQDCFDSLPIAEFNIFDKEPVKILVARAPWPEEIAKGGDALLGSCSFPRDMRSSAEWRTLGRYIWIKFPLNWPEFIPAAEWRFLAPQWIPDPALVGPAKIKRNGATFTYLKANYQSNDPDSANFMREVRSIFGSLLTTQVAFYGLIDGKYCAPWTEFYKKRYSRRLMKAICTMPNHYVYLRPRLAEKFHNYDRPVGLGPSPLFKEKVFKELGLPTDQIPGLAEVKAERAKKRQKAG